MKRFLAFLLAFLLLLSPTVLAHSGGTDANGGHYDRSTGEYHYHHGYPAHQHYDMNGDGVVDCPYNFDDQTGRRSGGSSTKSHAAPTKKPKQTPRPKPTPTPSPEPKHIDFQTVTVLLLCVGAIPIGFSVLALICAPIYLCVDRITRGKKRK